MKFESNLFVPHLISSTCHAMYCITFVMVQNCLFKVCLFNINNDL